MALSLPIRTARGRLCLLGAVLAVVAASSEASAQNSIATATVVRNDVTRAPRGGQSTTLVTGGGVFLEETVKTGTNSAARLIFRDDTALAIGALASITLDPGTFGATAAPKPVLTLVEGAFRYVSGATARKDVEIRTSVATIGIRGTVFDLRSTPTETVVTLIEGEIEVCPIAEPKVCVTLKPGQTARVTAGGPAVLSPTRFSFSSFCTTDPALCGVTRFATPARPVLPVGPAGGARPAAPAARTAASGVSTRIRIAGPLPTRIATPQTFTPPAAAEPEAALCGR